MHQTIVTVEVTNNGSDGDPHARRAHDTDAMFAVRQRMTTDDSNAILKQRPSIAEFPNAECRNCGLHQFRVRGLEKVRTIKPRSKKLLPGKMNRIHFQKKLTSSSGCYGPLR